VRSPEGGQQPTTGPDYKNEDGGHRTRYVMYVWHGGMACTMMHMVVIVNRLGAYQRVRRSPTHNVKPYSKLAGAFMNRYVHQNFSKPTLRGLHTHIPLVLRVQVI